MRSPRLDWAIAGGFAAWAAARLAGADGWQRAEQAAVPLLSLTPQAAVGAGLAALTLRRRGPAATAAVAAAALAGAVLPRSVRRRQPPAGGPVLRVLTLNLLYGQAAGPALVELVEQTKTDVLLLQELTDGAVTELTRAGLPDVLPGVRRDPRRYRYRGSGIYARYPLAEGLVIGPSFASQPTARLDLPDGPSVQLVCVHPHPPFPPWSAGVVPRWRRELSALPRPGAAGADPLILAGDFNATLDHVRLRRLLGQGYADAARQAGRGLVPTWAPRASGRPALLTFDHVLVDPRCAVLAVAAYPVPGSDHRALYAEIRLPG